MRKVAFLSGAFGLVVLAGMAAAPSFHGLAFVVRAAGVQGPVRRLADLDRVAITERLVVVPIRHASMVARVYEPVAPAHHSVLLVTGLHSAGIDEPRLIAFARRLAEARVTVVTPHIRELAQFEISPQITDHIEDAAVWLATNRALAPTGRIGLIGTSFSGGLAVVAAGRPSLRDRLRYVASVGGHDDVGRVLEHFCSGSAGGELVDGETEGDSRLPPPHDYGVAVLLLNVADGLVPSDQQGLLRDAVRQFLQASYLERDDPAAASREFARLRVRANDLPEPARTIVRYVNARDVARLGPLLRPHIRRFADQAALSPSQSPAPAAPVFLLHGRSDTVIPAGESERLAQRLEGRVPVHLLVTGLLSHARADQPARLADVYRLVRFWTALL